MRIVFAGTPEAAVPSLNALVDSTHEVVAVITRPDAPSGRGRKLVASPVAVRAGELGIPVLKPEHPRDPDFQTALAALEPEACPVVAYGALLPQSALDIPTHGWINLHFSILPEWRGAAPVQHSIWAGDEFTGATTFRIVKALDAGPTFGVMTERIKPTDTSGDLLERLAVGGATLLVQTISGIESGDLEAREQPSDGITFAPKILVEHAEIDWTQSAIAIDRQIRACTPAPGTWSTHDGERIKIGPVAVSGLVAEPATLAPGMLEVTKKSVFVGTGTTPVQLGEVKAFGKKLMQAADWARGVRLESGVRFGTS